MLRDVPDLSVKHLRAVVAVARFGSFIAASSYLRISQPGLSRIVQQAEKLLGVELFARGTRRVAQTPAGQDFIPVAERLIGEIGQQTQKMRTLDGAMRGQIVIASLMSICHRVLPAVLVAYRNRYPNVHIQIREGFGDGVQEDVRRGIADVGIGNVAGLHESVAVESVMIESCWLVMPRRHRLSSQAGVRFKDLAGEPMISMPPDAGLRRTVDIMASAQGVLLHHTLITSQYASLFDFVGSGLELAIVPVSALPRSADPSIVARPLRPAITRQIGILHPADRPISPPSQAFLDIFRPAFVAAITDATRAKAKRRAAAKGRRA